MTLPVDFFEGMYRRAEDPWGFATRWYEERKRAVLLACLPEARFASAYEPGCSLGLLTAELAGRCGAVLAADASTTALARAGERLGGHPNVRLERHQLPHDWPAGRTFDLVVLSEILYYFGDDDAVAVADLAVAAVEPGGCLVSAHWRHPVPGYPHGGDEAEQVLAVAARTALRRTVEHVEDDFRLTVHVRPRAGEPAGRLSVARRTGLC
jgi:SAM-dependent methyltransferase